LGFNDLMRVSLRMRPDRLIVGELRGAETVTFLRAINTGHPGSLSPIHASSPDGAFEQIALMCMQAGLVLSRDQAIGYARTMIDIAVQMSHKNGMRCVEDVRYGRSRTSAGYSSLCPWRKFLPCVQKPLRRLKLIPP